MTIDRNKQQHRKQEADRRVRRFFAEVHADDRAPSFEGMAQSLGPARHAAWPPAFAVLAVVLMAAGIAWVLPGLSGPVVPGPGGSLSEVQQLALAQDLSSFETPLDFLLDTPGREFLYAPPSLELMEIPIPQPIDPTLVLGENTS